MAENLIIHTGSKEEKYRELLPQLHALVSTEADLIANLANMAAALKQTFGFFWVGFYLVKEEDSYVVRFRPHCLHSHPLWQRSLRNRLERSPYTDCS